MAHALPCFMCHRYCPRLILATSAPLAMQTQEVGQLGATMYFGELALLRSEPRAATVTALTDCDLLELGRADFMALMGPLAKALEAHTARYGLNFSAKKARPWRQLRGMPAGRTRYQRCHA